MVTRALQAFRNAVPGKFMSLGDKSGETPALGQILPEAEVLTSLPSKGINNSAGNAGSQNLLNSTNGVLTDITQFQTKRVQTPLRASKKVIHNDEVAAKTISKKRRRKLQSSPEADGLDRGPTPSKEGGGSMIHVPSPTDAIQQNDHQRAADDVDNDTITHATSLHANGGRSTRRSMRRPRRFSFDIRDASCVASTSPMIKSPTKMLSTPNRRRGRPRKQPSPPPISRKEEEDEFGFREISTVDSPSVRNHVKSLQDPGGLPDRKSFGGKKSFSPAEQQSADPVGVHESVEAKVQSDAICLRSKAGYPELEPKAPSDSLREHSVISDDNTRHYSDLQKSDDVRNTFSSLERSLRASSSQAINIFKSEIVRGLVNRRPLVHMDEEYQKVQQLVQQTILAGEGNSMLVIGPRGCGKSALVETILSDLGHAHGYDFIVVRLNGFIHTDDKLALRETWRQLGREVAAEDDVSGARTNYADTLTSLLALLAHSAEDEGKENEIARSVIFVIDEFELFASHPRQTLLYNLFDVAQSRNAPVAVLGLTTRTDIVESLEKRVKSRFGQRYVHLTHPKTFNSFQDICKSALKGCEPTDATFLNRVSSAKGQVSKLRIAWDDYVDALCANDILFQSFLRHIFDRSKCVSTFVSCSLLPISLLSASNIPTGASFIEQSLLASDSKLQLISSLSDLELSLLIAAARLEIILDTDLCNFAMAYEEYAQLASRVKIQSSAAGQTAAGGARVWGKQVATASWEKLMELELIVPASIGMGSDGSRGMCRVDVALEEIGPSCPRMGTTMSRWCREI